MIITSHRKTGTSSWNKEKFKYSMVIRMKINLRRKTEFRHQKIDCIAQGHNSCFRGRGRQFWLKHKSQLFLYLSGPPLLLLPSGLLTLFHHLILTLIWEHNTHFSFKKIMYVFPFMTKCFTVLDSLLFPWLPYSFLIGSFRWFNLLLVSHTMEYSFCLSRSWTAKGICNRIGLWGKVFN